MSYDCGIRVNIVRARVRAAAECLFLKKKWLSGRKGV